MSDFVMMDYINETQEAALHIVDKSEDLCRVFAENFAKKPYERVILAASGTSYNACVTARYFMEKMLGVSCGKGSGRGRLRKNRSRKSRIRVKL